MLHLCYSSVLCSWIAKVSILIWWFPALVGSLCCSSELALALLDLYFCLFMTCLSRNLLLLANSASINSVYFQGNSWCLWYINILNSRFLNFCNPLWTLTQDNEHFFIYYYYSGYGSSPPFSQMDREHSSKPSAKALYGMYVYVIGCFRV